jgi:hypothetical protein
MSRRVPENFIPEKSGGEYTVEEMQFCASIASTADGLRLEGNNFKLGCLTGSPDMLLFACEKINSLEKEIERLKKNQ